MFHAQCQPTPPAKGYSSPIYAVPRFGCERFFAEGTERANDWMVGVSFPSRINLKGSSAIPSSPPLIHSWTFDRFFHFCDLTSSMNFSMSKCLKPTYLLLRQLPFAQNIAHPRARRSIPANAPSNKQPGIIGIGRDTTGQFAFFAHHKSARMTQMQAEIRENNLADS